MSLPQSKTAYLNVPGTAKGKNLKTYTRAEVAQVGRGRRRRRGA